MRYLIKNGSIIDPAQRVAMMGHVLIEDGIVAQLFDIAEMPSDAEPSGDDIEIIHANRCIVAPGFTDLHVHLREPGEEHKETIATATRAAARGGFTTICGMPNTQPPYDQASVVQHVRHIAARDGIVQVDIIGALTQGRQGLQLTNMAELVEAGCIAFSDDGSSIANPTIMRHAMAYASALGVPVMNHCEEVALNAGWAMHESSVSVRLGLAGYPAAAEEMHIARDITLAELTGAHLHICHVSTAGGIALIRQAKERGIRITAEVTPHHLTLTDQWVLGGMITEEAPANEKEGERSSKRSITDRLRNPQKATDKESIQPLSLNPRLLPPYDTRTRVSPPLRSEHDRQALLEALRDDTIDVIATDHAPHAFVDKACEYTYAACGISGLETALGLLLALVHTNACDLMNLVAKLTEGPAQVLGRAPSSLRPGTRADVVIFNPDVPWVVDTNDFASKGKNSPLHGQQLKGQVMLTMCGGTVVYRRGDFGRDSGSDLHTSRLDGILPNET